MISLSYKYFENRFNSEKNIKEHAIGLDQDIEKCQGTFMGSNAIYCGFCQGQCPLGVEKTMECRVIQGYECPYFCDPVNRELVAN